MLRFIGGVFVGMGVMVGLMLYNHKQCQSKRKPPTQSEPTEFNTTEEKNASSKTVVPPTNIVED